MQAARRPRGSVRRSRASGCESAGPCGGSTLWASCARLPDERRPHHGGAAPCEGRIRGVWVVVSRERCCQDVPSDACLRHATRFSACGDRTAPRLQYTALGERRESCRVSLHHTGGPRRENHVATHMDFPLVSSLLTAPNRCHASLPFHSTRHHPRLLDLIFCPAYRSLKKHRGAAALLLHGRWERSGFPRGICGHRWRL